MKLILLSILLSFKAFSSSAFTVDGELIYDDKDKGVTLKTEAGDLAITNKSFNAYGCQTGTFVVVNNFDDNNNYNILEIIQCKKFKEGEKEATCPKNIELSCGQPTSYCTEGEECIQQWPQAKTFDNKCLLIKSGAIFLYKGNCEDKIQN
jgi:hypothetical protein